MNRFKVGDRVRVRKDLVAGDCYTDGCYFNEFMADMRGNIYQIGEAIGNGDGLRYRLDGEKWSWTDDMLEPAEHQITIAYTGDKGEAHKALEAEIKRLSGAKATPERVERARALVGEILLGLIGGGYESVGSFRYAVFAGDGIGAAEERRSIHCTLLSRFGTEEVHTTAVCAPEDEYSVWIGRAVALCKAVGKELPGWLIGKEG